MYTEGSQSYLTVAAATGGSTTVEYVVMNPAAPGVLKAACAGPLYDHQLAAAV